MGLNNEHATRLVFDIETAPLAEAADYLEPAEAPGNYKDAAKIAEFIAAKNAENLERCGLDLDLCRVVAIGVQAEGAELVAATVDAFGGNETRLLQWFWNMATDRHLVGFNCIGFDLPVLQRRSLYLDVEMPTIAVDKYRHPQVTDLQQVLSYNGALKLRSLSFYARRFNLDVEDDVTGGDIAKLVAEGQWVAVAGHVTKDVQKTARLAEKLGYFRAVEAAVI